MMVHGLWSTLFLGFLMGIKHAFEPDHVVAVTTIASRSNRWYRSSLAGICWGIGHTATLFLVGMILIVLKGQISEKWALSLEFVVGIMLVYLGWSGMRSYRPVHTPRASYEKSLLVGFVHGLSGSAAMVLLTMTTVKTVVEGALYILIFGMGTVVGMFTFSTCIGIPFVMTSRNRMIHGVLTQAAAVLSTVYGLYYMYSTAVSEGLWRMWI